MAESAVTFLLEQLSTWLREERNLLGGLRHEAQLIHDELEQMRAFLRVADGREESDPQLAVWVSQVREIAYDTEDVLETYMLHCAPHPHSSGFGGCIKKLYSSIKNLKAKHQMANEIKAIRSRAESACKTYREMYDMPPAGSSSISIASNAWYDGRGDALLLEEADVVGIRRPKRKLLNWILASSYKLRVVSVVGMAGLGKTTLVKKVYDDQSLKKNFDHLVWITVSETYKIENLVRDMIMQLLEEVKQPPPLRLETMNEDGLREFVYNFLMNKMYVIVLDDIWNVNAWEALRYAFPRSTAHGQGCIIITTRLINIGEAACCESGGHIYHLKPLPPQDAEELFNRKAFPGALCPQHLKEISQNILNRCEGLPLAIVLIGGSLATKKDDIVEWTNFNLSLGTEVEGDDLKRMWKVLSLSYYELPYHLKACFLFLSNFPEDQLLKKATIIRLWIAEGFVKAKRGKTLEEAAEGYLYELCNRSMIQVAKTHDDGRPKKFRVHDVIREYVVSKAREHGMVAGKTQGGISRVRCLALDDNSVQDIEQISNFRYLHTLLFFGSFDYEWESVLHKVLCGDCRMLKELDLRGAPLDTIPDEVFKLYHLKYLSFRGTMVSLIPKSIGNLGKLETLDLKDSEVIELPIEILKLQRLRYLLVYSYVRNHEFDSIKSFKAPYEIGRLVNLQKICYVDASVNVKGTTIVKEMGKLRELRRLGIVNVGKEEGKELCSSLAKLDKLRSLSIGSTEEGEMLDLQYFVSATQSLPFLRYLELRGCLERVPQWVGCLNALTELYLWWSRLGEDPLKSLQGLPNLQILLLKCAYEGEGLSFEFGGFQKLRKLYLYEMRGLRWVRVEEGSMPCLDEFIMRECKAMKEVPVGIEHLPNLHYVGFNDMAEELVEELFKQKNRQGGINETLMEIEKKDFSRTGEEGKTQHSSGIV